MCSVAPARGDLRKTYISTDQPEFRSTVLVAMAVALATGQAPFGRRWQHLVRTAGTPRSTETLKGQILGLLNAAPELCPEPARGLCSTLDPLLGPHSLLNV